MSNETRPQKLSTFKAHCQKVSQKVSKSTLDLFFPQACFGCGALDTWLCQPCEHKIPLLLHQQCFRCQKTVTRYGEACYECEKNLSPSPLDAVFRAACYGTPVIQRMIHAYKYQFVESVSIPLGKLLAKAVEQSALPLPHIIIPVPLHKKRLRFRGFNQSAVLAEILVKNFSALDENSVQELIIRNRHTKSQQKTRSKEERTQNLKNAFSITSSTRNASQSDAGGPADSPNLRNQVAWLVDDVATTHSTLTECARVLKEAGIKKVYAVVLAQD